MGHPVFELRRFPGDLTICGDLRKYQLLWGRELQGRHAMNTSIRKFLAEEDGITALEYGILACLVASALVAIFFPALENLYTSLFGTMTTAVNKATG